jgi:Zn-dependent protease
MTLNPVKHMGVSSLIVLCLFGIAWGACPVNPRNFKSRYGDAWVALAGPLMNLLLMVVFAWMLAVFKTFGPMANQEEVITILWVGAYMNAALFLLNMIPLPPLDGATVLGSFSSAAQSFYRRVGQGGVAILFIILWVVPGASLLFWGGASTVASRTVELWDSVAASFL